MISCRIATTEDEVQDLAPAWRELFARAGTNPLSDVGPYNVWWNAIARAKGCTPHVVTGWRDGQLVAILPLVVRRRAGIRILFLAGYDVFLGPMAITEKEEDLSDLWRAVRQSRFYDVAEIRYVQDGSPLQSIIKTFPLATAIRKDVASIVRFDGRDGETWQKETLSGKHRSELRRRARLMAQKGEVDFKVYTNPIPEDILQGLIAHKRKWCLSQNINSYIIREDAFLNGLVKDGAARGTVRLLCLWCGQTPVGFCVGFIKDKKLLSYLITHDPAYFSFSPGFATNVHAIRWTADNGFDSFDLMEGPEPFKETLANVRTPTSTYLFCRSLPGLVGWLALAAQKKREDFHRQSRGGNE